MPNIAIDNAVLFPSVTFVRWKVHQDWVTQAKYLPSFQAVISSSNEEASSLVIGCVLPLTDAEQQLSEIREACYEACWLLEAWIDSYACGTHIFLENQLGF